MRYVQTRHENLRAKPFLTYDESPGLFALSRARGAPRHVLRINN